MNSNGHGQLNNIYCTFSVTNTDNILCAWIGENKDIKLYPYTYNKTYKCWQKQYSVTEFQCMNECIHWKADTLCVGGSYKTIVDIKTNLGDVRFNSW